MIVGHHYTPVERAMIRHQLRDPHERFPAIKVRCYGRGALWMPDKNPVCVVMTVDAVTTYYRYSRVHGVYQFRAVGGVA